MLDPLTHEKRVFRKQYFRFLLSRRTWRAWSLLGFKMHLTGKTAPQEINETPFS
jgi:hypothetical protein